MSKEVQPTTAKKTRARRSPEMIAELIWEAERKNSAAEVCRRENISPTLFYRWKQKFKEAGIQGLKSMKRGPKTRDLEKESLARENARLSAALCESSIELQLLKKSVSSDYMGR
jgi:transposase-like protein